eukprot:TCALIF_12463-PA protein Name:"Protein of unknown function" AED:0.44 eAED:0.44 QI:0/0/0/0.25/1/1/4/0/184
MRLRKIISAVFSLPLENLIGKQVKPLPDPDPIFNPYPTPDTGPYFDLHRTVNVTALKGVTTHLVCRVKRLGNHTVSWIRIADTSLLTVGRYTYTTDLRFEAFHSPHTDDWIVRLKNPKPKDTGIYGCQISTTPHQTHLVHLVVHDSLHSEPDGLKVHYVALQEIYFLARSNNNMIPLQEPCNAF